ncbi:hypothetical protein J6590_107389, partial [Homalodisca vitripennis]
MGGRGGLRRVDPDSVLLQAVLVSTSQNDFVIFSTSTVLPTNASAHLNVAQPATRTSLTSYRATALNHSHVEIWTLKDTACE